MSLGAFSVIVKSSVGPPTHLYVIRPLFPVRKVSMFSASAKAGLCVGDTLVGINDWNIEAMDNIQVHVQCIDTDTYVDSTPYISTLID